MRATRGGRLGVGAVLPMVLVAGLAVAALTSHAAGEARADDHQLELVAIEAGDGKTQSCIRTADGSSCVGQPEATHVASTVVDEHDTPKVKKNSCARVKR